MKYITKYKSPNYNSRKNSKIKLIIIHYTALDNYSDAISYLCNKDKKVSSHFLISQEGGIYYLVDEKFRAWHAGISYWQGITDINSISLGIELDYSPHGENNKFSFKMINSLKKLILKLQKKYLIKKNNILAHSDVAPFRKQDPGKYFPWKTLSLAKITLDFTNVKRSEIRIIENWLKNYNIKSKKHITIFILSLIGYDTREVYKNNKYYNKLINNYAIRYLNKENYKNRKLIYNHLVKHLLKFLLTKD